jgi:3-phytase
LQSGAGGGKHRPYEDFSLTPTVFKTLLLFPVAGALLLACQTNSQPSAPTTGPQAAVQPTVVTQPVAHDTDDPAVWVNPTDPAQSLIIGTDKDQDGGLYVFNLRGEIQTDKVVKNLRRPNNVDVEYGLPLGGKPTDIAVATERLTHKLRIFSLPDMKPVDGGGIAVFVGETGPEFRDLMGISLYKTKAGVIYAMVGRKSGPTTGGYLWQYRLADDGTGKVAATLVRKFGTYSGRKEIESIAVDDALGYVYYSDEGVGVRQYYADPEKGNAELALFATEGFTQDHEGISIYALTDSTGYILVSDQGANRFHVFSREGTKEKPFFHQPLAVVNVSATQSDGSETIARPLGPQFPHGLFVAMSDNRTFHLYRWEDIAGTKLKSIGAK